MIHADGFPFWQKIKQYTSLKTIPTTLLGKGTILASWSDAIPCSLLLGFWVKMIKSVKMGTNVPICYHHLHGRVSYANMYSISSTITIWSSLMGMLTFCLLGSLEIVLN
jgi:hypothetical protein